MSDNEFYDFTRKRPNHGVNAGGCHPVPLRDPYVLWDSRNFVPTEYGPAVDVGGGVWQVGGPLSNPASYFGGAVSSRRGLTYWGPLYNEGTKGNLFDLHTYYEWPGLNNTDTLGIISASKYLNWYSGTDLGTHWPTTWDDYEGDPCEAPFTNIYGLGHLGRNEDWFTYVSNQWMDAATYNAIDHTASLFFEQFVGDIPTYDSFAQMYFSDYWEGIQINPSVIEDTLGEEYPPDLNNNILTITVDPRCNESWVWVGTTLIKSADAGWISGIVYRETRGDPCDLWSPDPPSYVESLIEFRSHESEYLRDGSDYVPGTAWTGIVGAAKFRGSPSLEDLLYWQEYFRADANFAAGVVETQPVAITDSREVYPNPFRYQYTGAVQTYTVPRGVTNIKITCWGAGRATADDGLGGAGGMAEAEFTVTPGDVYDVYVGGRPSGNNGGWPNGGTPQPGNNNEGQPGCGSSHVIPTGQAFANALVVGGGGGGTNGIGSSRNTPVEGVHAGNGGYPAGEDGNGVTGPDDGIEWGGRGGDQTTGGAVGTSTGGSGNSTPGDFTGQGIGGRAAGSSNFFHFAGGSGGGGWHGGGGAGFPRLYGGGSYAGDGGGGSSYTAPSGTNANYSNGSRWGHGMIEILALHDPEDIG